MSESFAWAAGIFDGEGAVTVCRGRVRLAVKMCDEESVRRFGRIVERGTVYGPYGPYKSSLGHQPHFYWVAEEDDARYVATILLPWVGTIRSDSMRERGLVT